MNAAEIMKQIESEQMKESVSEFHVGDTVKVYGKIVEGNRERIHEENYLKMYHVALGMIKNQADAENAVQEAFLSLAEKFEKYLHLSGSEMTGLCVSIVKNKIIDIIRRANHYSEEELENLILYDECQEHNASFMAEKKEEGAFVHRALSQIPEVFREALILKYCYCLSNLKIF